MANPIVSLAALIGQKERPTKNEIVSLLETIWERMREKNYEVLCSSLGNRHGASGFVFSFCLPYQLYYYTVPRVDMLSVVSLDVENLVVVA